MPDSPLSDLISASGMQGDRAFLDGICSHVTDDMLGEIALADYGMDFDAHLKALKKLRARELSKTRMAWEPKEVLELFRWSEWGDDRTGQASRSEVDFHLMRAFCCGLILEAYATPANHEDFSGINQTIIQLLDSTSVIGPVHAAGLSDFLCWLIPQVPSFEEERAFYGLALVWALLRAGEIAEPQARFIISVIDACEAEFRLLLKVWPESFGKPHDRWLLGWTHFDLCHEKWLDLSIDLATLAQTVRDDDLRDRLQRLSRWLTIDGAYRDDA